jgi:hypothetical protein
MTERDKLVSELRRNAADCENMERWATPELAPLLRKAADAISAPAPSAGSPASAVSDALFPADVVEDGGKCITTYEASLNLQGALYDLKRYKSKLRPPDDVCIRTIERVVEQLEQARAALSEQFPSTAINSDASMLGMSEAEFKRETAMAAFMSMPVPASAEPDQFMEDYKRDTVNGLIEENAQLREQIARMLVPYWYGGFELQEANEDGSAWKYPPGTPNKRAYEIADKALAALSAAPVSAPAGNGIKDPRDVKLELVEGGLLLLLDAVKAGDPANEIVWRIQDELRVLRGTAPPRNERVPPAQEGAK